MDGKKMLEALVRAWCDQNDQRIINITITEKGEKHGREAEDAWSA